VPEIVGGILAIKPAGATVIVKADSDLDLLPSLTEIRMFENVPVAVGVPLSRPVLLLKLAQAGRLLTENVSVRPSGSVAEGWKE
jgi:hypothetical protein